LITLLLIFAICVSPRLTNDFESKSYQLKSANEKSDLIWNNIIHNTTSLGFYTGAPLELILRGLSHTFDHESDTLPEGRKKLIHTVGNVGKVSFVPSGPKNDYTGIFRGAAFGYLRLSIAKDTTTSDPSPQAALGNFLPGMGLKFLRTGLKSSNLVAMESLGGQDSWNYFKNDFTNHIKPAEGMFFKVVGWKFSGQTDYILSMGLKDWAEYKENGKPEANPVYPYQLIFRPADELRTGFPDKYKEDFTIQLGTLKKGMKVYTVFAKKTPKSVPEKIGKLILNSEMTTSNWGDERLFFQHNKFDEDILDHPKWSKNEFKWSTFGVEEKKCKAKSEWGCPFLSGWK